jgi:sugar (pentulose or hexulose) kinase
MATGPEAIAVLDVGRTNVELVAVTPGGRILTSRQAPNVVLADGPYPHPDVEHIERWLMAALADFGERYRVLAIVPTTYGSAAALLGAEDLAMPVMDPAANQPDELAAAYAEVAPWFEACFCGVAPGGLTLARQLFWQRHALAGAWAEVRRIVPYPQYWAWRLSGVAASEITSLGAQSQLWDFARGGFSSLAHREGFADLLAPVRRAYEVLGPITPAVAEQAELPPATPVLTGIHDLGANYARYLAAGLDDFSLISTGPWLVTCRPGLPLAALDPLRETAASLDLEGRPVTSARFMGGRDLARLAGEPATEPTEADLQAVIDAGTLALPSFSSNTNGGPFPGRAGHQRVAGPKPRSARARSALTTLYVALMAAADLDRLQADTGPIILDGDLVDQPLFARVLAALRPAQEVLVSPERAGPAIGAALLYGWEERREPVPVPLEPVAPLALRGLEAYARRWREMAVEPQREAVG